MNDLNSLTIENKLAVQGNHRTAAGRSPAMFLFLFTAWFAALALSLIHI